MNTNRALLRLAPCAASLAATIASATFYSADAVLTVPTGTGAGSVRIEVGDPGYRNVLGPCASVSASAGTPGSPGFPSEPPPGVSLPFGLLRVEATGCNWRWGRYFDWGGVLPPPPPLTRRVNLELEQDLPAGMVAWVHGPGPENPVPHWREVPTGIAGKRAVFDASRFPVEGDDPAEAFTRLTIVAALGIPAHAAIPGSFQDLWWAGPQENGWGLSITQHRDVLFVALFIYDGQGDPRWLVIPGGEWNSARTEFSGAVHRPTGSPHALGGNAAFSANSPVGNATLAFDSRDTATLSYTIDGVSDSKRISRQLFGPARPMPAPRLDDLWWSNGSDKGWGFALAQQFDSLFGVWYTYDAEGATTWFVLPAGAWDATGTVFAGTLYRTRGAPWLGVPYDPARLEVIPSGSASLTFTPELRTMRFQHEVAPRPSPTLTPQPF